MLAGTAVQHLGGRDQQHDSLHSEPGLHVVADGNGLLGDCSAKAISLFRRHLGSAAPTAATLERAIRDTDADLCTYLRTEIATALDEWRAAKHEALQMLGTEFFENELSSGSTFVAYVADSYLVHVGDSRAYHVSRGARSLTQLTRDHVWPEDAETVDVDGTIYKHGLAMQRVLGHPRLRPLGVTCDPDIASFTLPAGDALLLCSDGLRPFLERDDGARLFELLAAPDPAAAIIAEAARIASDNVSLILVGA